MQNAEVQGIRRVKNGFIIELGWPYCASPGTTEEFVFTSLDDVFEVIRDALGDPEDDQ